MGRARRARGRHVPHGRQTAVRQTIRSQEMKQELTTDQVSRRIEATPEAVYVFVSDATRTPEYSPEVVRCTWIKGATGPVVGARFRAVNSAGRVPDWPNKPVVTAADPGKAFAF